MRIPVFAMTVAAGAVCICATDAVAQASHAHMGHVADRWNDTPDQAGLLPTAVAEAEIAHRHAGLAVGSDDLARIQAHIGHVLHAIDPEEMANGPGKGYGVTKAAAGAARHIRLAADADGASDNVKTHATHVAASAENVGRWAQQIVDLCQRVAAAGDAETASELAMEIEELTGAIVNGHDANEDGRISWQEGEGGLEQAAFHLNLMKRGEGQS